MNKNVLYVVLLAVLCGLAGVLVGASITKKAGLPLRGHERPYLREKSGRRSPQQRPFAREAERRGGPGIHAALADKLGLSQEQDVKVQAILENTRKEIEKVGGDVRGAIQMIKEKSDGQIMAILTPEQQEKFKGLLERAKDQRPIGPGTTRQGGPERGFGPGPRGPSSEETPPPPPEDIPPED